MCLHTLNLFLSALSRVWQVFLRCEEFLASHHIWGQNCHASCVAAGSALGLDAHRNVSGRVFQIPSPCLQCELPSVCLDAGISESKDPAGTFLHIACLLPAEQLISTEGIILSDV